jgi:Flp pilus assembly protein TadG
MQLHISSRGQERRAGPRHGRQRGQSLAEFALILTPLMAVLLGIMQMGLILNAYVTISNASREGARAATIYVYDRTQTKANNDIARAESARATINQSMGMLSNSAPQFANSSTWTVSGSTYTTGDLQLSYSLPTGVTESDARTGQYVTVRMTYHLDLIIPLIGDLMPKDAGGRMPLTVQVTMVVN